MRLILLLVLALFAAVSMADSSSQQRVFRDECAKVNPKQTGFECRITDTGMRLNIMEPSAVPPARLEKIKTEFDRIALRYIELGFSRFTYLWVEQPTHIYYCYRKKKVSYPAFYCDPPAFYTP